jgi:hypothetical protein
MGTDGGRLKIVIEVTPGLSRLNPPVRPVFCCCVSELFNVLQY